MFCSMLVVKKKQLVSNWKKSGGGRFRVLVELKNIY
jgi:hypothetical protein